MVVYLGIPTVMFLKIVALFLLYILNSELYQRIKHLTQEKENEE